MHSNPVEFEPGDEVDWVLNELVGADQASMRRELFGDQGTAGKLEFRVSDAGPRKTLRARVTKRQAHAVLGLCEGVCTVRDSELWANPDFLQVALFDDDGIANGGIHLLVIEVDGKRYLTLPGINPSSHLLEEIDPAEFLARTIDFAWALAHEWKLDGVWIPVDSVIHSNRPPIQAAIRARFTRRDVRKIAPARFSHSPSYMIKKVYAVPDPALSQSERIAEPATLHGGGGQALWELMRNYPRVFVQWLIAGLGGALLLKDLLEGLPFYTSKAGVILHVSVIGFLAIASATVRHYTNPALMRRFA